MPRDPNRTESSDAPPPGALARSLIAALMREDARGRTPQEHPALEALLAYRAGTATIAQRAALQAHLGGCPECVRTLGDLESFVAPADPGHDAAADLEEVAGWRRLQPALREQLGTDARAGAAAVSAGAGRPASSPPGFARRSPALAIAAAVLATTTGGLLVQTYRLDHRLALYDEPSAEVSVLYLEAGEQRSAGEAAQRYEVSGQAPSFLLMIESPDLLATGCCAVEIRTEAGDPKWKGHGVPGDLGALRVSVPTSFLPAGAYWIVVRSEPAAPGARGSELLKEKIEIRYR